MRKNAGVFVLWVFLQWDEMRSKTSLIWAREKPGNVLYVE